MLTSRVRRHFAFLFAYQPCQAPFYILVCLPAVLGAILHFISYVYCDTVVGPWRHRAITCPTFTQEGAGVRPRFSLRQPGVIEPADRMPIGRAQATVRGAAARPWRFFGETFRESVVYGDLSREAVKRASCAFRELFPQLPRRSLPVSRRFENYAENIPPRCFHGYGNSVLLIQFVFFILLFSF